MDNIHAVSETSKLNGHFSTEQPNPTNKTSSQKDLGLSESEYERINKSKFESVFTEFVDLKENQIEVMLDIAYRDSNYVCIHRLEFLRYGEMLLGMKLHAERLLNALDVMVCMKKVIEENLKTSTASKERGVAKNDEKSTNNANSVPIENSE